MSYEVSAYVLAGFLTIYSIYFYAASNRTNDKGEVLRGSTLLLLLSLAYAFLAQFGLLAGLTYSMELTEAAPCENLLNTTYTDPTTNVTQHAYYDSCAGNTPPETHAQLWIVYAWYVWIGLFLLLLGGVYLTWRAMGRW